jgi:hypothetical protein
MTRDMTINQISGSTDARFGEELIRAAKALRNQRGEIWYREYFSFENMMAKMQLPVGGLRREA